MGNGFSSLSEISTKTQNIIGKQVHNIEQKKQYANKCIGKNRTPSNILSRTFSKKPVVREQKVKDAASGFGKQTKEWKSTLSFARKDLTNSAKKTLQKNLPVKKKGDGEEVKKYTGTKKLSGKRKRSLEFENATYLVNKDDFPAGERSSPKCGKWSETEDMSSRSRKYDSFSISPPKLRQKEDSGNRGREKKCDDGGLTRKRKYSPDVETQETRGLIAGSPKPEKHFSRRDTFSVSPPSLPSLTPSLSPPGEIRCINVQGSSHNMSIEDMRLTSQLKYVRLFPDNVAILSGKKIMFLHHLRNASS